MIKETTRDRRLLWRKLFAKLAAAYFCLYVVAFCLAMAATAQDRDTSEELGEVPDRLSEVVREGFTNVEFFETNGFRIETSKATELGANLRPSGTEFQLMSVTARETFRITIENGRSMSIGGGIGVFHRESGQPMLAVSDSDNDGALDLLEYSQVDDDGNILLTVIDYEADGQADLRLNFAERHSQIWHADRWHSIEKRDDRQGILIDGEFLELRRENNHLFVP